MCGSIPPTTKDISPSGPGNEVFAKRGITDVQRAGSTSGAIVGTGNCGNSTPIWHYDLNFAGAEAQYRNAAEQGLFDHHSPISSGCSTVGIECRAICESVGRKGSKNLARWGQRNRVPDLKTLFYPVLHLNLIAYPLGIKWNLSVDKIIRKPLPIRLVPCGSLAC